MKEFKLRIPGDEETEYDADLLEAHVDMVALERIITDGAPGARPA